MDEQAKKYRKQQFNRLVGEQLHYHFCPTIIISTVNGCTNYMNITDKELDGIKSILTGEN